MKAITAPMKLSEVPVGSLFAYRFHGTVFTCIRRAPADHEEEPPQQIPVLYVDDGASGYLPPDTNAFPPIGFDHQPHATETFRTGVVTILKRAVERMWNPPITGFSDAIADAELCCLRDLGIVSESDIEDTRRWLISNNRKKSVPECIERWRSLDNCLDCRERSLAPTQVEEAFYVGPKCLELWRSL